MLELYIDIITDYVRADMSDIFFVKYRSPCSAGEALYSSLVAENSIIPLHGLSINEKREIYAMTIGTEKERIKQAKAITCYRQLKKLLCQTT